ncbi:MAG: aminotransferase class III-fold pyridoxal phosphate-dependent enzyme [Planctomycetes bacterium]|nr:aminotransferase class III-fold pyridoxal phosphate-dependent enzyme [Planctomycetota bacterium]
MSRVTEQYLKACQYLAGGVSASTRLNKAVGHAMLFDRADGCRVWDLDGYEYLDLCCSHGATLLGHGDPRVRRAVGLDGTADGAGGELGPAAVQPP